MSQNLSGENNIFSGNQIARLVGNVSVDQAYRVYNCPPLEPVVSSLNAVHTLTHPAFGAVLIFLSGFLPKMFSACFHLSHVCFMSVLM
jgi:hypothetical protein